MKRSSRIGKHSSSGFVADNNSDGGLLVNRLRVLPLIITHRQGDLGAAARRWRCRLQRERRNLNLMVESGSGSGGGGGRSRRQRPRTTGRRGRGAPCGASHEHLAWHKCRRSAVRAPRGRIHCLIADVRLVRSGLEFQGIPTAAAAGTTEAAAISTGNALDSLLPALGLHCSTATL